MKKINFTVGLFVLLFVTTTYGNKAFRLDLEVKETSRLQKWGLSYSLFFPHLSGEENEVRLRDPYWKLHYLNRSGETLLSQRKGLDDKELRCLKEKKPRFCDLSAIESRFFLFAKTCRLRLELRDARGEVLAQTENSFWGGCRPKFQGRPRIDFSWEKRVFSSSLPTPDSPYELAPRQKLKAQLVVSGQRRESERTQLLALAKNRDGDILWSSLEEIVVDPEDEGARHIPFSLPIPEFIWDQTCHVELVADASFQVFEKNKGNNLVSSYAGDCRKTSRDLPADGAIWVKRTGQNIQVGIANLGQRKLRGRLPFVLKLFNQQGERVETVKRNQSGVVYPGGGYTMEKIKVFPRNVCRIEATFDPDWRHPDANRENNTFKINTCERGTR